MRGFGAYGKMPSLGDFFRLGAPRSFCTPWDVWLQSLLTQTRADLGARWEDCYMSAPIWRFALAPGLAGPEAAMGVLMPSVDRVGRAFPLTLVRVGAGGAPDYATLEEIALSALDDTMSKDKLAQALADLPQGETQAKPQTGAHWRATLEGETIPFETTALPKGGEALRLFDPQTNTVRA
jgi:type VI secretion system protein ImpM